jgi:hypothetical protein
MDRASGKLIVRSTEAHASNAAIEFAPALDAALVDGWLLDARAGGVVKRLGATAVWLKDQE